MKVYVAVVDYSSAFRDPGVIGVFTSKEGAKRSVETWARDWNLVEIIWDEDDELIEGDWTVRIIEQDLREDSLFFTYRQNNSGGRYEYDDQLSAYVIVEAKNAEEANKRAEELGIEFDEGCETCGDRWSRADDYDGEKVPMVYDRDVSGGVYQVRGSAKRSVPVAGYIHYYDRKVTVNWA